MESTASKPSVVLPSVDPVIARVLTPSVQTGEGRFAGLIALVSALFVISVAQGWIAVDGPTKDFVLQWIPIAVISLGGAALGVRSGLKAWVAHRWKQPPAP